MTFLGSTIFFGFLSPPHQSGAALVVVNSKEIFNLPKTKTHR
jgi:hypothetical protein